MGIAASFEATINLNTRKNNHQDAQREREQPLAITAGQSHPRSS
jgi:hypothetical protein